MKRLTILSSITSILLASSSLAAASIYQAKPSQPFHISVGAVLFNNEGKIACHYFNEILGHKDLYILMRESMENNEAPLTTLSRGLREEFGATATPLAFIGSLVGTIQDPTNTKFAFEKTTLYFACQLDKWNPNTRDINDPEGSSEIKWLEPNVLINIFEQQNERFHRIDADESLMIKRALPYFKKMND